MLKNSLKNTKYLNKIAKFYKKNKSEIHDIVLFGSSVKGKYKPKDVDIILVFKNKENLDLEYEFRKIIKDLNPEVVSKTKESVFSPNFKARESYFLEGYSLVSNEKISEKYGFFSSVLFKYSLKNKSKSQRMLFYYALYGRGAQKGIIKEYDLVKFSESTILCPVEKSENLKAFFLQWEIEYNEFPVLMPLRIKNIL